MSTPATDRTLLDALLGDADAKLRARNAIDGTTTPVAWLAAHELARVACMAAHSERKRLWGLDRWGAWMSANDMMYAGITGEL